MSPPTRAPGPVFVLGVHRSGTTWLSQSLARRGRAVPFTVRHLLSAVENTPHTVESTTRRLQDAGVVERPGDGLPVHAHTSEEYGYLLALRHGSSRTTARSLPTLQDAIARLGAEHPHHTPILRNPWDYAATHKLAAWFPHARFVFVHRSPIATVGSAVEMFRDFWTHPHPYGLLMSPRYRRAWDSWWQRRLFQAACRRPRLVARIVASGTALAHSAHLTDSLDLPAHRHHHIRYTDLLASPGPVVDRLLHALHIPIDGPELHAAAPRTTPDRPWLDGVSARLTRRTTRYRQARALDENTE